MAAPPDPADLLLLRAAVARDPGAVREVVRRLTPVIQNRIARILLRGCRDRTSSIRREVEDITQDVLLALFDKQGQTLLSWNPERGTTLEGFASVVAERLVITILRNRQRNPFQLEPHDPTDFDQADTKATHADDALGARQTLLALAQTLRAQLSPLGLEMFYRLFVWEESVAVVSENAGLGVEAVYQWRSRLKKQVQTLVEQAETRQ